MTKDRLDELRGRMGMVTDKQKGALERFGVCPDDVENCGKASLLLDRLMKRATEGLSTPKQIRKLESYGFVKVGTWTKEDASDMMSRIAFNGWRVPFDIDPGTYVPGGAA